MSPNIRGYTSILSLTYDFVLTFHCTLSVSCIVCKISVTVQKFSGNIQQQTFTFMGKLSHADFKMLTYHNGKIQTLCSILLFVI